MDRWTLEQAAAHGAARVPETDPATGRLLWRCRVLGRDGPWIYVDPDDVEIAPHLARSGCWEPWLTAALLRHLRRGMRCVDVGANCGYYALLMADRVGPTGRVLAVEPHPALAALIRRSAEANRFGHLEVAAVAAGRQGSEATLRVRHADDGRRYLGGSSLYFDASRPADAYAVPVRSLDALLASWDRVDLVKVDVEGAELDALAGMAQTVARSPHLVLIVELAAGRGYDVETAARDLTAFFGLFLVDVSGDLQPATPAEVAQRVRRQEVAEVWCER